MRIFLEKTVKFVSAAGAPPPNPRLPPAAGSSAPNPRVVTPTYYYNFVEFIFSWKMRFIPLKKETSNYSKCSAFASFALFHLFFNSSSLSFVEGGRKNISCPRAQSTLATLLFIRLKM